MPEQEKRYENEQLAFWGNLEDNIHSISEKLKCHNYPPDIYHHFYVYEPKLRKVMFSDFLGDVLKLRLNNKTAIRPVSHGMEFVGYTIRPFDVRLRKSTSLRMKRHLKTIQELYRDYEIDLDRARSTLMSYKALMDHCDCRALEKKIFEDFVLTHNPKEADTDNG